MSFTGIISSVISFFTALWLFVSGTLPGVLPVVYDADYAVSESSAVKTSFGGTSNEIITGSDAKDGSFYVCGYTSSKNGTFTGLPSGTHTYFSFLRKYDSSGNLVWSKNNSSKSYSVYFTDVCVLKNGNVAVCGYRYENEVKYSYYEQTPIVCEYTDAGVLKWTEVADGTYGDSFSCIAPTTNGFVVGGSANSTDGTFDGIDSFGSFNAILIRYQITADDSGTESCSIVWNRYLAGEAGSEITAVATDVYNNVFASCSTLAVQGNFEKYTSLQKNSRDNVIIRYNANGTEMWSYTIASSYTDEFTAIAADGSGGCIAGGYIAYAKAPVGLDMGGTLSGTEFYGCMDSMVFRISSAGALSWKKQVGGSGSDMLTDIVKISGGWLICGYTESANRDFSSNEGEFDCFIETLTTAGEKSDALTFGGSREDRAITMCVSGTDLMVFGMSLSQDGFFDGLCTTTSEESNYFDAYTAKFSLS